MMDQATHQQETIYASFLSQIDWTKWILVHKSHEKNWINFQNWIWKRNGSAGFNLVFWILVVEILILMVNNNSTVHRSHYLTWLGIFKSGIPGNPRESQTVVWDPRESMIRQESGIPGNESRSTGVWNPQREWIPDSDPAIHGSLGSQGMNPIRIPADSVPVWIPMGGIRSYHSAKAQMGVKLVNRNENRRPRDLVTDRPTDRSRLCTDI